MEAQRTGVSALQMADLYYFGLYGMLHRVQLFRIW